ncbi:hypothetical protein HZB01_00975 [Candidatus Woesearchaeota archaeon]|nr:hypothetical protein [Candidatus Woesearchaeota archaeon]
MKPLTNMETEIILKLFRDFTVDYNPSNIANELKRTRVGTFKALKALEKRGIVQGKKLGKAMFYTLNLRDDYAKKYVQVLLMEEARQRQRWLFEFEGLFNYVHIAVLFGSIIQNEKEANDIDLMIVLEQKDNSAINKIINEKNKILPKRIHIIKQTIQDIISNIKKRDKLVLNAFKYGIVLHGFEELVEVMKNVTSQEYG